MRKDLRVWGVGMIASGLAVACLDRPVGQVDPRTTNLYVEPIRNEAIDKIDLLFMIDNSVSMGDKQKLLSRAVPQLVDRLVIPRCVSQQGAIQQRSSLAEDCPMGMAPEFRAVKDIHVAVITSSLGAHGAPISGCTGKPPLDDRAQLLPKVRTELGLSSYADSGFLAWDPMQIAQPPGEQDRTRLGQQFGAMVQAAGEDGCGFEASLEAWYRFLVDPEPPLQISVSEGRSVASGIDTELLAQRAAFLRPDSLVTIVMLTDENDCSIRDDEFGHYVANQADGHRMPRGTSACQRDPNDPCCMPCNVISPLPPGCPALADDSACQLGASLSEVEDPHGLRCLDHKRRFGYDFLYPTSRYVNALTQPEVARRSTGEMVENPLFARAPGKPRRTSNLIYLAGIVGVPWQDIADDASRAGAGLRYLDASELSAKGRWDVILGNPAAGVAPTDPFMRESTTPRSGTSPITGDAVVPDSSLNPLASAINGHEQRDLGDDLQYACTFPLAAPEPCTDRSCDCAAEDVARNRPLCQPAAGGPPETTQYFGKAYPGLRTLEVLRGIGDSAVVASICPKILTEGQPGYGYEPAVDAIVDRLKGALLGRCPPRPLAVAQGADGKLPCVVIEAKPSDGAACSCAAAGRSVADRSAIGLVKRELVQDDACDVPGQPSCDSFCFCELAQAEGESRNQCLNDELGSDTPGYCYVDPYGEPPQGNAALVAGCSASNQRLIRFVGPDTPTPGATAFIACLGQTLR